MISYNYSLTSLAALENVTSVEGDLFIANTDFLTSLTGLDNINAGSINNLVIYNNKSLSLCEVQSICDYLASPNGTITIDVNATGCGSKQEVEAACEVGVKESAVNSQQSLFTLTPHPLPSPSQCPIRQIKTHI
jgi:hypothetical protein